MSIKWRTYHIEIASTITSYPSINFVLYVPSQEEAPLRIHDSKDQPLLTSAFLIPRWGGIVIKNPPKAATEEYRFTKKDLQPIMKIFISQLRSLIGIHDLEANISRKFVSSSRFWAFSSTYSRLLQSYLAF